MSSLSFTDLVGPAVPAAWLNDVNTVTYTGFGQWLANSPQPLNYSDTGILGALVTNTPGYNQLIVGNLNTGATASSSYLAGNNLTTANTNYVEFGINGGGYTGAGAFSGAGYGYLATASTDLAIGTYGNNSIHFVVNSGATDAMTISGAGVVNIPNATITNAAITNLSGVVLLTGNQTIAGVKTFSSAPVFASAPAVTTAQSMVQLTGGNGFGSTNTSIRRYTTTQTNQGSDITYADSATLGGTFTINTNGVYSVETYDYSTSGATNIGVSLNSNQLTTTILSITAATRLTSASASGANTLGCCSWTGYIAAGGVVRGHGDAGANATNQVGFTITRVS